MKKYYFSFLIFTFAIILTSCSKNDQDDIIKEVSEPEVRNFVYQGLNIYYLYKEDIEVLDDNYFSDKNELFDYLNTYDTPEDLFESLLSNQDRFSFIVPDFHVLEDQFSGITLNDGMDFVLYRISEDSGNLMGVIRYILPNTSAERQGLKRGILFNRIDGETLTESNYRELLNSESYELGLAELGESENEIQIVSSDKSVHLNKERYTENPIYMDTTYTNGNHKIGYLMYNSFTSSFDKELNGVFGDFKAKGITDLVVDLRYNGGGSIETSRALASMITGDNKQKIFIKEIFNENFDNQEITFTDKVGKGESINSLNLNKVYILTSNSTASASELLINGLDPYIDVVQIGENTVGKFQGSITVYDSEDFSRSAVKPGHNYAMQPLILKSANSKGVSDYVNGLSPDIEYEENPFMYGFLGDTDEPLLQKAIEDITSKTQSRAKTGFEQRSVNRQLQPFGERKMNQLDYQRMYTDKKEE